MLPNVFRTWSVTVPTTASRISDSAERVEEENGKDSMCLASFVGCSWGDTAAFEEMAGW